MTMWNTGRSGGLLRLRGMTARALGAGLAAWLLLVPNAASAQTRTVETATSNVQAAILEPASLLKTEDMDFGRIAARTTIGTVVMNPATSICTPTGGLVHAGICKPAEFAGRGRRNLTARITFPTSVNLVRTGGGTMLLDNFNFYASPDLVLITNGNGNGVGNIRYLIVSTSGMFTMRVGGTLHVGANQAPGTYNGTFNVSVQYF